MAGKRKPKRAGAAHEDVSKPSKWRLQHGGFGDPVREADPETGSPVEHRRAVDTLGQMLANGTITQEMHDAAAIFRRQFRAAALDGLRGAALVRLPLPVFSGSTRCTKTGLTPHPGDETGASSQHHQPDPSTTPPMPSLPTSPGMLARKRRERNSFESLSRCGLKLVRATVSTVVEVRPRHG